MNKYLRRVTGFALLTRICIILLQFVSNIVIPDLETDAFITPAINISKSIFDDYVFWIFGGFLRWDAHHFMNVAVYGYVFEHTLAFFPGHPFCIRAVGTILQFFCGEYLNIISIYLISSLFLNVILFILATRSLFYLTYKTFNDKKLAFLAASLFTINPASIFFTAPYSEALFSYLTFQVMLQNNVWISSIYVFFSALVRSNGVINLGFPIYRILKQFVSHSISCRSFFIFILKLLFICLISLSSFAWYQFYGHSSFCALYNYNFDQQFVELAEKESYILRGQNITNMCETRLPYFYIQNRYWNVGFLNYFKFKKLHNFAFAFPILYFTITHGVKYFIQNAHLIPTLGMKSSPKDIVRVNFFPYGVHLIVLIVTCLFFIHIEVSTRLLCSSTPTVYWFAALLLRAKKQTTRRRINVFGFSFNVDFVLLYFLSYSVIGTILFSNFFPWT